MKYIIFKLCPLSKTSPLKRLATLGLKHKKMFDSQTHKKLKSLNELTAVLTQGEAIVWKCITLKCIWTLTESSLSSECFFFFILKIEFVKLRCVVCLFLQEWCSKEPFK